ncbi:Hypothetical predicted protein [Cloeon dipterum]|uniref:Uncharacterized protein n=1 Tax=Cloeon dipterum TaxID=197152 RepID=A0A8S1E6Y7_9INSE|nr:Hypothetical predicted protein [Cloeon dipterum]
MARTLHQGYYVPGYAVEGVGFFVSKDRQPFQTDDYQVLVNTYFQFLEYTENHEKGMVADDQADESNRIKIGSFLIDGKRFCGIVLTVDDQNACCINFENELQTKNAPEFQIPVDMTDEIQEPDPEEEEKNAILIKKFRAGELTLQKR